MALATRMMAVLLVAVGSACVSVAPLDVTHSDAARDSSIYPDVDGTDRSVDAPSAETADVFVTTACGESFIAGIVRLFDGRTIEVCNPLSSIGVRYQERIPGTCEPLWVAASAPGGGNGFQFSAEGQPFASLGVSTLGIVFQRTESCPRGEPYCAFGAAAGRNFCDVRVLQRGTLGDVVEAALVSPCVLPELPLSTPMPASVTLLAWRVRGRLTSDGANPGSGDAAVTCR